MYVVKFVTFFLLLLAKKIFLFGRHISSASAARAQGFSLAEGAHIWKGKKGVVDIARGVSIGRGTLIRLTPDGEYVSKISIGEGTSINEYNNIIATGGLISIGKYCQVAQFCTIVVNNHETETSDYMIRAPLSKKKTSIIIGDDVWIASNSVILAGVCIGNGAVVAAGSIVTRDIPPYTIVAGNPARVIRQRILHR